MIGILKSRVAVGVGTLLVGIVGAGAVTYAIADGPDDTFYACETSTGKIRSGTIRTGTAPICRPDRGEEVASWNSEGQPGPAGQDGAQGPPGSPGVALEDYCDLALLSLARSEKLPAQCEDFRPSLEAALVAAFEDLDNSGAVSVGDRITQTATLTNTGPVPVTGTVLSTNSTLSTAIIDQGLLTYSFSDEVVSSEGGSVAAPTPYETVLDVGTLDVGETVSFTRSGTLASWSHIFGSSPLIQLRLVYSSRYLDAETNGNASANGGVQDCAMPCSLTLT